MLKNRKLGIIIPAYKPEFLKPALESILQQSNQEFDLYVFNDGSPHDLDSIISKYSGFEYHSFDKNLGKNNLVQHWHRCLEFVRNPYIWLFSDDDIASPACVESFYNEINQFDQDLVIIPSERIDSSGMNQGKYAPSPDFETVNDFLVNRLQRKRASCLPDHIFKREAFEKYCDNKIPEFPKAWNSDDALWLSLGQEKGLKKLKNCTIYIRTSGLNISSTTGYDMEKIIADYQFINWVKNSSHLWNDEIKDLFKEWMLYRLRNEYSVSFKNVLQLYSRNEIVKAPYIDKYFLLRYTLLRSMRGSMNNILGKAKIKSIAVLKL